MIPATDWSRWEEYEAVTARLKEPPTNLGYVQWMERNRRNETPDTPPYYMLCMYCGENAYDMWNMPTVGSEILAANVVHSDHPKSGEVIRCQHCKHSLDELDINIKNIFRRQKK